MLRILLALLSGVAIVAAGDVSGRWQAEVAGDRGRVVRETFDLTAHGSGLEGTFTDGLGKSQRISDGTVSGDTVSFGIVGPVNGEPRACTFQGTLSGDELRLQLWFDGAPLGRERVARRLKN